jgi:hypothetical protein
MLPNRGARHAEQSAGIAQAEVLSERADGFVHGSAQLGRGCFSFLAGAVGTPNGCAKVRGQPNVFFENGGARYPLGVT